MYYYQNNDEPDRFYNSPGHGPSSEPYIRNGGYLLPQPDRNIPFGNQQPTMRPQDTKKITARDTYDETYDGYTLARNSGILTDFPTTDQDVTNDQNRNGNPNEKTKKGLSTLEKLMISFLIFLILVMGGVCAYIVMRRQGTAINQYLLCNHNLFIKVFFLNTLNTFSILRRTIKLDNILWRPPW